MAAFSRLERLGRADRCPGHRLERLGVGNVRCNAVVEQVAQPDVAAERLITLGISGIAAVVESGARVDPVLTTSQGKAPVVQCHLVLDV
ncbi:hypothetical protein D3C73_852080 [compost metagenome]